MGNLSRSALFERRTRFADRRGWEAMPETPFVDSDGNVVTADRRLLADRRLNSIRVEVTPQEVAGPSPRPCR